MAFKEKYTPEEWRTFQFSPLWVFNAVAGADNKIDKKEAKALDSVVANSGKFFNDLAREIFMEIQKDFEHIKVDFEKETRSVEAGLQEVAQLVEAKVNPEIALNFKKTLIAIGVLIGHSSGGFFGSKLSEEEIAQVERVGELLNVSVKELQKPPDLQQILQNLSS
jgi:uncharacterized tellurite resistance protein B-like protein